VDLSTTTATLSKSGDSYKMAFKRIFDVDGDSPAASKVDDIVGRFRSGHQLNGQPAALSEWRVTGSDPVALNQVVGLLGGDEAGKWDTKSEETYEVFTEANSIDIILDGPKALRTSMVLWGRKGKIRECDGAVQTDEAVSECACPSDLAEKKEGAKIGTACEPSIQIYFRLANQPDLGKFKFFTGSWTMAKDLWEAEEALAEIGGPAYATLTLELVEFTTKSGKHVQYTKPVLDITGAADSGDPIYGDEEPF
jgi:hypothetical protein